MGTSKSNRPAKGWTGEALLFSGRPDPTWRIDPLTAKKLAVIWTSLPPWAGSVPATPALGYRGCFARNNNSREWLVYRSMVTLSVAGRVESRRDAQQQFEKLLLASAPGGMIPLSFIAAK